MDIAVAEKRDTAAASGALRVAIAGYGAIGHAVARRLDAGVPGLALAAVASRNVERVRAATADFRNPPPVESLARLAELADIVLECLPAAAFMEVAEPTLRAGRTLVVASVGQLLAQPQLKNLAVRHGGRILVPTGALIGLDAVTAAAEGEIRSVKLVTRKPPKGLVGAPHLVTNKIDVEAMTVPTMVFSGTAREAVKGFPANVNVAAALSLAGIGPDRTTIEVWADPTLNRNKHTIVVDADSAQFSMTIENVPTEENPRTGKITALSVIACLRKLASPVRIGT
ncbi:MAG TPA: aspartate dehydrogenase [Alphaproteobacteria bacterium]|nr:aspartate dehydrogenase [Alphaproteobacteria bacterium]